MKRPKGIAMGHQGAAWRFWASLAATAGAVTLLAVGAPAAHADVSPWQSGTLFVAESGNYNGVGGIVVVPPTGSPYRLNNTGADSAWDVAADAAGDLYYVNSVAGTVNEYDTSASTSTLASGFQYPYALTIAPSGDLLVSDQNGIWSVPAGGGTQTKVSNFGGSSSLVTDAAGNIYFSSTTKGIFVLVGGSGSPYGIGGIGDINEVNSVRFDNAGDLFAAGYFYDQSYELPIGGTTAEAFAAATGLAWAATPDGNGGVYSDNGEGSGEVVDTAAPGDTPEVLASGLDGPAGMSTWPPQAAPAVPASTVALTTDAPGSHVVSTVREVTFTATVTSPGSAGLVSFDLDGQSIGQVALVDGVAKMTTRLPAGTPNVRAVYLGDSNAALSLSNAVQFMVNKVRSKTAVASPNGSALPQDTPATINVSIGGPDTTDPYSSADITDNGVAVGSVPFGTTSPDGTTSIPLFAGLNKIVASYVGDDIRAGSVSKTLRIKAVPPFAATISADLSAGTKTGLKTAVSALVTVTPPVGAPAPLGRVVASNGFRCPALVASGGVATTTCTGSLRDGTWSIAFTYQGSRKFDSATGYGDITLGGG